MVKRIFVEKKEGYNVSAKNLLRISKNVLSISVEDVRDLSDMMWKTSNLVFSKAQRRRFSASNP